MKEFMQRAVYITPTNASLLPAQKVLSDAMRFRPFLRNTHAESIREVPWASKPKLSNSFIIHKENSIRV